MTGPFPPLLVSTVYVYVEGVPLGRFFLFNLGEIHDINQKRLNVLYLHCHRELQFLRFFTFPNTRKQKRLNAMYLHRELQFFALFDFIYTVFALYLHSVCSVCPFRLSVSRSEIPGEKY